MGAGITETKQPKKKMCEGRFEELLLQLAIKGFSLREKGRLSDICVTLHDNNISLDKRNVVHCMKLLVLGKSI